MAKPYGRLPKARSGYNDAGPRESKPSITVKIKESLLPGEMSITLQATIAHLEKLGLHECSYASLYITPLDKDGNPVMLKNEDGSVCKEIIAVPYRFVAPDLKV